MPEIKNYSIAFCSKAHQSSDMHADAWDIPLSLYWFDETVMCYDVPSFIDNTASRMTATTRYVSYSRTIFSSVIDLNLGTCVEFRPTL